MVSKDELLKLRATEQKRIAKTLAEAKGEYYETLLQGESAVAFVHEDKCIGCDQCTLVCDDKAIELYHVDMKSPLMKVDNNLKAKILRDPCTGCRLCVLACPTDAIEMINR